MARSTSETRTETRLPTEDLKSAHDAAMAFPIERVNELRLPPGFLAEKANEEARSAGSASITTV